MRLCSACDRRGNNGKDADFGRVVDDLALIAQAGWEGDFTDLIRYVPL